MKLYRSNVVCIWIGLIYFFSQQGFYLFAESPIFKAGTGILILLFILYVRKICLRVDKWSLLMFCPIIISLIASIVEKYYFPDTQLINAFIQQAQWWMFGLLYFPLDSCLAQEVVSTEQLKKTVMTVGVIQLLIGITQYFLTDYYIFVHVTINSRYNSPRYYYPIVLMVFTLFLALEKIISSKEKNKVVYIIVFIMALFEIAVVQKYRATLIGVLISLFVFFYLWKQGIAKKILISIPCIALFLIIATRGTIVQDTINSLLYNSDNSFGMRGTLIDFLVSNFKSSLAFGKGYVSSPNALSYAASAYRNKYSWDVFAFADGGIFSIAYSYGLLGISWFACLWCVMIKNGKKIWNNTFDPIFICFPLYMLSTIYIDIHWYIHMQFFSIALFCAIEKYELKLYDVGSDKDEKNGINKMEYSLK